MPRKNKTIKGFQGVCYMKLICIPGFIPRGIPGGTLEELHGGMLWGIHEEILWEVSKINPRENPDKMKSETSGETL